MRRAFAAIAIFVVLTACTAQSRVYRTPIAQARETLLATGLPPHVFDSQNLAVEVVDGGSAISWIARRGDVELFRYVAQLSEEGPGATRVVVTMQGVESGPAGNTEKSLSEHPAAKDLYLTAMNERIASALQHRDFQAAVLYPKMAAAGMFNVAKIQAQVDDVAAASERQERSNIEKAYADEAAGRR